MKAKKIIPCIVLILLALLVLFAIIFCWPKKMEQLLGNREISSFSGTAIIVSISYGRAQHDTWTVDHGLVTEDMVTQLEEIMYSCRYSPALKTLWQPSSFELNGSCSAYLILTLADGSTVMVDYMGEDIVRLHSFSTSFDLILRPVNKEVSSQLAEFMIEIGEKL